MESVINRGIGDIKSTLADIAKYLNAPIATYTHMANTEIVISAVDTDTNTLTSAAHGLSNNDVLYPCLNYTAGNVYLPNILPGGLAKDTPYYVVNKSDNAFQVSLTSGGAAVDITVNASVDLTKWHFEKLPATGFTISNLGALTKARLRIRGRTLSTANGKYITITGMTPATTEWAKTGSTAYGSANIPNCNGDVMLDAEVTIDYTKHFSVKVEGISVQSNNTTANTITLIDAQLKNMNFRAGTFTDLIFTYFYPANGLTVEVYKA
jgi:hypothetical protein